MSDNDLEKQKVAAAQAVKDLDEALKQNPHPERENLFSSTLNAARDKADAIANSETAVNPADVAGFHDAIRDAVDLIDLQIENLQDYVPSAIKPKSRRGRGTETPTQDKPGFTKSAVQKNLEKLRGDLNTTAVHMNEAGLRDILETTPKTPEEARDYAVAGLTDAGRSFKRRMPNSALDFTSAIDAAGTLDKDGAAAFAEKTDALQQDIGKALSDIQERKTQIATDIDKSVQVETKAHDDKEQREKEQDKEREKNRSKHRSGAGRDRKDRDDEKDKKDDQKLEDKIKDIRAFGQKKLDEQNALADVYEAARDDLNDVRAKVAAVFPDAMKEKTQAQPEAQPEPDAPTLTTRLDALNDIRERTKRIDVSKETAPIRDKSIKDAIEAQFDVIVLEAVRLGGIVDPKPAAIKEGDNKEKPPEARALNESDTAGIKGAITEIRTQLKLLKGKYHNGKSDAPTSDKPSIIEQQQARELENEKQAAEKIEKRLKSIEEATQKAVSLPMPSKRSMIAPGEQAILAQLIPGGFVPVSEALAVAPPPTIPGGGGRIYRT